MTESTETDTLSLFPLSGVVLFPRLKRPLYIFELRYRQMTESALAGDRRIGMVTVRPEYRGEMSGDPPIYNVGCTGVLDRWRRRDDGSFDVLLQGTSRFEILEELAPQDGRLFRRARIRNLAESPTSGENVKLARLRDEVRLKASELLALRSPEQLETFRSAAFQNLDAEAFVNTLALAFEFEEVEKQSLLEAPSIEQRYDGLLTLLHFRLRNPLGCGPSDPGRIQ